MVGTQARRWPSTAGKICVAVLTVILWVCPAKAQGCFGDCNGDGTVTAAEIETGVSIALGEAPLSSCPAVGSNNALVRVPELLRAIADQRSNCSSPPRAGVASSAANGPIVLHIGSASGAPGATVSVGVTLDTAGQSVAGVQIDTAFDPNAPIAANA